jgi:hypothetical protein
MNFEKNTKESMRHIIVKVEFDEYVECEIAMGGKLRKGNRRP